MDPAIHSPEPASLTVEEAEAILAEVSFPPTFLARQHRQVDVNAMVTDWGALGPEHVAAVEAHVAAGSPSLGTTLGPRVAKMRHSHHRMAQLLAGGMGNNEVAALCGVTAVYVHQLKAQDPAFQELLAHYAATAEEGFADFISAAAALNMDMLDRLRDVLDESPEKLSPGLLLEAIRTLSDRTGHAPVTKSVAINVNADVGSRLKAAQERLRRVQAGADA